MTTPLWAVLLMIVCTFFTSTAQIFMKTGSSQLPLIFWNLPLFAGIALYGIGAVLLIVSLKAGDVTVLYPIVATSYIWVTLSSIWIFNEHVSFLRWMGIFAIISGICFIGWGSKKNGEAEA